MNPSKLIFVYAVDGGIYHTLIDVAHKLVSPSTYPCNLCALTYGPLSQDKDWKTFIKTIKIPMEFLHRDEFIKRYPKTRDPLPVVFLLGEEGLQSVISASEINQMKKIEDLITAVQGKVLNHP